MRHVPALLGLLFCAACGGKIAPGTGGDVAPAPAPDPTPAAAPAAPDPNPPSDPFAGGSTCQKVCDRNGLCGAQPDVQSCLDRCTNETTGGGCVSEASVYYACFAAHVDDTQCTELSTACEGAYCAYARCTGQPLPPYCG